MNGINIEIENLVTPNINDLLSGQEQEARLLLMDEIIKNDGPVNPSGLLSNKMIHALLTKGVIVLDDDSVSVVYPVSALPTPHQVKLQDGRSFYSICAVDSLGSTFVFHQDIAVTSSCSHCKKPVSVTIENGEVSEFEPDDIYVTHTDLVGEMNWAGTC